MSRKMVRFSVHGKPVGKGRSKHRNVPLPNGKVFTQEYTPAETRNYEQIVRLEYERQIGGLRFPKEDAIGMKILIVKPIPKSTSKRRREMMLVNKIYPGKKPDSSNVVKAIEDGLNGVAYVDDTQIVHHEVDAVYGEQPRVDIVLWAVGLNG